MTHIVDLLADALRHHGIDLLIGSSVVLAGFTLMVLLCRSLSGKHRIAGTAIVAVAAYALVALVPLPRLALQPDQGTAPRQAIAGVATADAGEPTDGLPPMRAPMALLPVSPPRSVAGELAAELAEQPEPIEASVGANTLLASTEISEANVAYWMSWLLVIGASLFAAQLLIGWLRLRRILRASRPASTRLQRLVELPKGTRLCISTLPTQPFCCGLLRSTIVLPRSMAEPSQATRFVLLHEREHLRSGDARMRAIAALLRPLLFWHPLFWWLQQQLRFTGELLADDAAAEGTVADYVRCMLTLAAESTPSPTGTLVATVFHRRSELFRRLEMMLQRDTVLSRSLAPWQRRLRALSAVALVTLSAAAFGVEPAMAQDPVQQQSLRDEIDRLRATIRDLKAELQATRPKADAVPPIAAEPAGAEHTYVIERGDTIERIAKKFYSTPDGVDIIRRLNPDMDPRRMAVGQRLIVDRQPPTSLEMLLAPGNRKSDSKISFSEPDLFRGTTDAASLHGLADLITRCIELRGEVEIQEIECKHARDAAQTGVGDEREAKIAEIRLRTKRSQYEAIASMLKAELDRAEAELKRSKTLAQNGLVPKDEVRAAENRIKLLRSVLR